MKKNRNLKDVIVIHQNHKAARQMFGRGAKADDTIPGQPQQGESAALSLVDFDVVIEYEFGPFRIKTIPSKHCSFL